MKTCRSRAARAVENEFKRSNVLSLSLSLSLCLNKTYTKPAPPPHLVYKHPHLVRKRIAFTRLDCMKMISKTHGIPTISRSFHTRLLQIHAWYKGTDLTLDRAQGELYDSPAGASIRDTVTTSLVSNIGKMFQRSSG